MAILQSTAESTQMQSATTPRNPVQEESVLTQSASTLSGLMSLGSQSMKVDGVKRAQEAEAVGSRTVAAHFSHQMKVMDAVDKGMPIEQARIRLRKNLSQAVESNPNLYDDILGVESRFRSLSGLGSTIIEDTEEETARKAIIKEGITIGSYDPSASPEIQEQQIKNTQKFMKDKAELSRASEELNYAKSRISTTSTINAAASSTMELEDKVTERRYSESLKNVSSSYSTLFKDTQSKVLTDFDSGALDQASALQRIELNFSGIQDILNATAGGTNANQVESLVKPMVNLYNFSKDYVSGTIDKLTYENKVQTEIKRHQLLIINSNEKTAATIAASQLLPNIQGGFTNLQNQIAINYVDSVSENTPVPTVFTKEEDKKPVFALVESYITDSSLGRTSPEQEEEGMNATKKLFKDLDVFAMAIDNPTQLDKYVKLIANPEFATWVGSNGGMESVVSQKVSEIIQMEYKGPVLESIKQDWEEGKAYGISAWSGARGKRDEGADFNSIVEPYFTASGLSFRSKAGVSRTDTNAAIRALSKRVVPKLNRLILSGAHMEGHKNYQKIFDENYAEILGYKEKEGDVSD